MAELLPCILFGEVQSRIYYLPPKYTIFVPHSRRKLRLELIRQFRNQNCVENQDCFLMKATGGPDMFDNTGGPPEHTLFGNFNYLRTIKNVFIMVNFLRTMLTFQPRYFPQWSPWHLHDFDQILDVFLKLLYLPFVGIHTRLNELHEHAALLHHHWDNTTLHDEMLRVYYSCGNLALLAFRHLSFWISELKLRYVDFSTLMESFLGNAPVDCLLVLTSIKSIVARGFRVWI